MIRNTKTTLWVFRSKYDSKLACAYLAMVYKFPSILDMAIFAELLSASLLELIDSKILLYSTYYFQKRQTQYAHSLWLFGLLN